jgi:hypothetical protein
VTTARSDWVATGGRARLLLWLVGLAGMRRLPMKVVADTLNWAFDRRGYELTADRTGRPRASVAR